MRINFTITDDSICHKGKIKSKESLECEDLNSDCDTYAMKKLQPSSRIYTAVPT